MLLLAAGPMQSGKQENRGTFEDCGFAVVDLNDLANEARLSDPTVRATYLRLGLEGTVTETGGHSLAYYTTMLARPNVQPRAVAAVVQGVAERLVPLLRQQAGNVVVSWGYAHLVGALLAQADHILLFAADETVWFNRLRRRAAAMSGSPVPLSDAQIRRLIATNGMSLPSIKEAIAAAGRSFHCVDTSPEDWGCQNLRTLLSDLLNS